MFFLDTLGEKLARDQPRLISLRMLDVSPPCYGGNGRFLPPFFGLSFLLSSFFCSNLGSAESRIALLRNR